MRKISDEHKKAYAMYYANRGTPRATRPPPLVNEMAALADKIGAETIIDYGCGAARALSTFMELPVTDFDPAIPECDAWPEKADLVVCNHMLEHVENELYLTHVFNDLFRLSRKGLYIGISTERSTKMLPTGTPWHTLVRPKEWWIKRLRLEGKFTEMPIQRPGKELAVFFGAGC